MLYKINRIFCIFLERDEEMEVIPYKTIISIKKIT